VLQSIAKYLPASVMFLIAPAAGAPPPAGATCGSPLPHRRMRRNERICCQIFGSGPPRYGVTAIAISMRSRKVPAV
jgi:hypothetical protein